MDVDRFAAFVLASAVVLVIPGPTILLVVTRSLNHGASVRRATVAGVVLGDPAIFDGLFGVFNDSLPDGWGRLLLDRTVERLGILRGSLTPLDRLAYIGGHGMGALSYEPDHSKADDETVVLKLDKVAAEAATVLAAPRWVRRVACPPSWGMA